MGFVPVPNRTVGTSMKRNKDLYRWFAGVNVANIYSGDWIGKKIKIGQLRTRKDDDLGWILFKLTVCCFKSLNITISQYFSNFDFDFTLSTLS